VLALYLVLHSSAIAGGARKTARAVAVLALGSSRRYAFARAGAPACLAGRLAGRVRRAFPAIHSALSVTPDAFADGAACAAVITGQVAGASAVLAGELARAAADRAVRIVAGNPCPSGAASGNEKPGRHQRSAKGQFRHHPHANSLLS
jgi:hypothetical protein